MTGFWNADVAQLVERELPKLEVAGSRPVVRFFYAVVLACLRALPLCDPLPLAEAPFWLASR